MRRQVGSNVERFPSKVIVLVGDINRVVDFMGVPVAADISRWLTRSLVAITPTAICGVATDLAIVETWAFARLVHITEVLQR